MGKFHDTLSGWDAGDTGIELPDDWRDSLTAAYDEDFSSAVAKNDQLNSELETVSSTSQSEIAKLKADNYDLLMQIPNTDPGTNPHSDSNDDGPDPDITIDDLFGEDK